MIFQLRHLMNYHNNFFYDNISIGSYTYLFNGINFLVSQTNIKYNGI